MIQDWEPWCLPFVPASGWHALDIGGNIGQWALGLSQRFKQVTTFEPTPDLAAKIVGLALPNVAVIQKAAWITNGRVQFTVHGDTPHGFGIWSTVSGVQDRAESTGQEITVDAVAIDSLGLVDVDFIKLDVEGAEVPALMGMAKTVARCKPQMLIECHQPEHYAWCVAFLDRHGYNVTTINGPGYEPQTKEWATHRWLFAKRYK